MKKTVPYVRMGIERGTPRSRDAAGVALQYRQQCCHSRSDLRDSDSHKRVSPDRGENMADIERISVEKAHERANQALLVCAYEDEAKCRRVNLRGSISLASFQSRASSLPKTQEIIFY